MAAEITSRAAVTGINVAANESGLALAVTSSTLEHMCFAAIDVLDGGHRFEEAVNRCIPMLQETCCECMSN